MPFTDIFPLAAAALLALYGVFLVFKLVNEYRFRRKPFVAMKELAWQSQQPDPESKLLHEIFLVGDYGYADPEGNDPVTKILQQQIAAASASSTLIFLGDNVYPVGLPPENHRHFAMAEKRLKGQVTLLQHFKGKVIYLSGNHDWNKGRPNGYEQLLRQEQFMNTRLGQVFLPPTGCPGPVLVDVLPELAIVVINTQWWVQRGLKPAGPEFGCTVSTEEEFFKELDRLLTENQYRRVLIAAHHPLYSNALHGGNHSLKQHLFPLTAAHKRLYVPVPLLGSLYPVYRKLFGASEDMAHPRYRRLRKKLLKILKKQTKLVYAAGHDHNLQHFRRKGNHYLISGSGSKIAYVKKGGKASFTHEQLGFMKLSFYSNNELWLTVMVPEEAGNSGNGTTVVYRSKLD